jgi:hypothetical protein
MSKPLGSPAPGCSQLQRNTQNNREGLCSVMQPLTICRKFASVSSHHLALLNQLAPATAEFPSHTALASSGRRRRVCVCFADRQIRKSSE